MELKSMADMERDHEAAVESMDAVQRLAYDRAVRAGTLMHRKGWSFTNSLREIFKDDGAE